MECESEDTLLNAIRHGKDNGISLVEAIHFLFAHIKKNDMFFQREIYGKNTILTA